MSTIPNDNSFQIFVGFGGSGCNALAEMTACIRDDFKAGIKAEKSLCFLMVDTDTTDLEKYSAMIRDNLSDYFADRVSPMIHMLNLGAPWSRGERFDHSIKERFSRINDRHPDSYDSYCESFWMRAPGDPFTFPYIVDPTKGAGQMPLSSHVMAWWSADNLRKVMDEAVTQVIQRRAGDTQRCDIYFVNSLAGGTGRGCWSALAFMLVSILAEKSVAAVPYGLFLDASTFHDIPGEQQSRLKLNSATGISEILMWLRNSHKGETENKKNQYLLLHPDHPDTALAVVNNLGMLPVASNEEVSRGMHQSSFTGSPVNHACLLFGANQSGLVCPTKSEYQRQAGQILYALFKYSDFVSKKINNEVLRLFSLGSSTYRVPIDAIKDYMNEYAKLSLLEKYFTKDVPSFNAEEAFADLFGMAPEEAVHKNADWNFIQRLDSMVAEKAQVLYGTTTLGQLLTDEETTKQVVKDWLEAGEAFDKEPGSGCVLGDFLNAYATTAGVASGPAVKGVKPGQVLAGVLGRRIFKPDIGPDKSVYSIKQCLTVLSEAKSYLESLEIYFRARVEKKEWKGSVKLSPERYLHRSIVSLHELVEKYKGGGGFLGLGGGERFDKGERGDLEEKALQAIRGKLSNSLLEELVAALPLASQELGEIKSTVSSLLAVVEKEVKSIRTSLEGLKAEAFISRPEQVALKDIADPADQEAHYRITFKSPMSPKIEEAIKKAILHSIEGKESSAADEAITTLRKLISDAVQLEAQTHGALADHDGEKLQEFRLQVRQNLAVVVNSLETDESFLKREFGLGRVLLRYVEEAKGYIRKMAGKQRSEIIQQYRDVLGVKLDEEQESISPSELIIGLASFAARHTKPWARYAGVKRYEMVGSTYVYAPFGGDMTIDDMKRRLPNRVDGVSVDAEIKENDHFQLVGLACAKFDGWRDDNQSENLGGLVSLNFWKNPEVKELLEAAEVTTRESNLAVGGFVKTEYSRRGGIGYIDPRFVFDEKWRELRWKPWAPNNASADSVYQRYFVYLLLGQLAAKSKTEGGTRQHIIGGLVERLQRKGWKLGILSRQGTSSNWKFDRFVYAEDKLSPQGFHGRGLGVTEDPWSDVEMRRGLNEVLGKVKGFSLAHRKRLDWEITRLANLLPEISQTGDEKNALRDNAQDLYRELLEEARDNFRNRADTLPVLEAFLNVRELEAAYDSLLTAKS